VPGDQPTIQAGVDSAPPGGTVLVAPGLYQGEGNNDITFGGKFVELRSEAGAARTVIDCGGGDGPRRSGFRFIPGGANVVIEGFTVRGGRAGGGAAVNCQNVSPTFIRCVFTGNVATDSGGAVRCKGSSPIFSQCTFAGNASPAGSALFLIADSTPLLDRCIIVFGSGSAAVFASDTGSRAALRCCDVYGNEGGDWVGEIASQAGVAGNRSVDPQFCDWGRRDLRLRPESPCLAGSEACAGFIGALDAGCGP
jgi:predicted outer membrane repeat protein